MAPGIRGSFEQQVRGGGTWILVPGAALPQVAGASLAGDQGNGGEHPLPGSLLPRPAARVNPSPEPADFFKNSTAEQERVQHRLIAG